MNADTLYELLPAIYRLRDDEQGKPLAALMAVIAEQAEAVAESLAQLYDDQFIETAAAWVVPYIGDLIGYRGLNGEASPLLGSPRSEVANTIGYRRRKGTAAMLEQLARDVTGWDAAVVEFFQILATTQYMNHLRPGNHYAPHLGDVAALERINTPFDTAAHTADVRRIARGRGKHNIPNIGIFLWRIGEYSLTRSPAAGLGDGRYRFHPLGLDAPLYNDALPVPDFAGLATPANVPQPIPRRAMARDLAAYYGLGRSLLIERHPVDGGGVFDPAGEPVEVPMADVIVCDLSNVDDGGGGVTWAHLPVPADKVAVDPVLGRLAFGTAPADVVLVTFHYGFPADKGGGEYERAATFQEQLTPVTPVSMPGPLADALNVAQAGGAVLIQDSGRYVETQAVASVLADGAHVEIRARNGSRPIVIVEGGWQIDGGPGSELTLNGLLLAGDAVRIRGEVARLRIRHCTLRQPLIVEAPGVRVEIEDSLLGAVFVHERSTITIQDSIIDAGAATDWAYSGPAGAPGEQPGGSLTVLHSTLVGRVWAAAMPLASNTIFLARGPAAEPPDGDAEPPEDAVETPDLASLRVRVDQRQEGCVRFSFVPDPSRTPRRHMCQPAEGVDPLRVQPQFTSLRYGDAGYGQLSRRCAVEITTGADDGSEMGPYHDLLAPQRAANLTVRLDEYLRFGLEAGIFFVS